MGPFKLLTAPTLGGGLLAGPIQAPNKARRPNGHRAGGRPGLIGIGRRVKVVSSLESYPELGGRAATERLMTVNVSSHGGST